MDKHVLHNILHRDAGNNSKDCAVCNGSIGMNDKSALMSKANEILARKQQMGMAYSEDEKELIDFAELNSQARNNLEDSSFAYIDSKGGKHLPIPDASHVRNALARFNQTHFDSDEDKQKAKAKIDAAAKKFGVDVSEKKNSEPMLRSIINIMEFSEKADEPPKKIKLLKAGVINSPVYGRIELNKKVFEDMINHYNSDLRASSSKVGIPVDVEHGQTALKDAAAAWIKKLFIENGDLWGATDWTSLGEEKLKTKQYKFISPAFYLKGYKDPETGKEYENVFTGAGLVNRPGMPSLPPLVNSEQKENTPLTEESHSATVFIELKNEINSLPKMNLREIAAKEQSQRSSDEQAFLVTNKNDLTFSEYKKEFPNEFKEPVREKQETKPGEVTMSEKDINELKAKADNGEKAFAELQVIKKEKELIEMKEKVKEIAFVEGKGMRLPTDQVEKWAAKLVSMSEADRNDTLEMLKGLPVKEIFKEKGSDEAINMAENPGAQLSALAKAKQAEAKKNGQEMSYSEAEDAIMKEKPELYNAVFPRN